MFNGLTIDAVSDTTEFNSSTINGQLKNKFVVTLCIVSHLFEYQN